MGASYAVFNISDPSDTYVLNLLKEKFYDTAPKLLKVSDVYCVEIEKDKKSLGIAEIKKGINFLNEKPLVLKYRYLLVKKADKMTADAQNALLKTLEEPNEHSIIFLFSQNEGGLLPTVLSRCKKIYFSSDKQDTAVKTGNTRNILEKTIGGRLEICEHLSKEEKEDIILELKNMEQVIRKKAILLNTGAEKISYSTALQKIEDRIKELEKLNVNTKLALEELLVNL